MTSFLIGARAAQRPVLADVWRRALAHLLRAFAARLARQARALTRPLEARQRRLPGADTLEFHAEAGAPEGALFLDGELVGWIDVRRL